MSFSWKVNVFHSFCQLKEKLFLPHDQRVPRYPILNRRGFFPISSSPHPFHISKYWSNSNQCGKLNFLNATRCNTLVVDACYWLAVGIRNLSVAFGNTTDRSTVSDRLFLHRCHTVRTDFVIFYRKKKRLKSGMPGCDVMCDSLPSNENDQCQLAKQVKIQVPWGNPLYLFSDWFNARNAHANFVVCVKAFFNGVPAGVISSSSWLYT